MQNLPNVAFIHGSGQSGHSFNYLQIFLPEHNLINLEYETQEDPETILKRFEMQTHAQFGVEPFFIISHSYGGLLASLFASRNDKVQNIVTLSSPWNGSRTAGWLSMVFRQSKLFMNMKPNSSFIKEIQQIELDIPILNVITTGAEAGSGNDLAGMGAANDGLLTLLTQRSVPEGFSNCKTIEVPLSHNEVLLCYDTVNIIKHHTFRVVNE